MVVFENSSASFTCKSSCVAIEWKVNGNSSPVGECCWYEESPRPPGASVLKIEVALKSCNNSIVTCITGSRDNNTKEESNATLVIQG